MGPAQKLGIHLSSLERENWGLECCLAWARGTGIDFFEAGPELPEAWPRAHLVRQFVDQHAIGFGALEVSIASRGGLLDLAGFEWAKEAGCEQVILAGLEFDRLKSICPELSAAAERSGIAISVDVSGELASRAEELPEILEKFTSPCVRVAIDTGRVLSAGRDPLELAVLFEGRLGHFRLRAGLQETREPVLRSVFELLLDGDYRGGLAILDESGRAEALAEKLAEVRQALELTLTNRREPLTRARGSRSEGDADCGVLPRASDRVREE